MFSGPSGFFLVFALFFFSFALALFSTPIFSKYSVGSRVLALIVIGVILYLLYLLIDLIGQIWYYGSWILAIVLVLVAYFPFPKQRLIEKS